MNLFFHIIELPPVVALIFFGTGWACAINSRNRRGKRDAESLQSRLLKPGEPRSLGVKIDKLGEPARYGHAPAPARDRREMMFGEIEIIVNAQPHQTRAQEFSYGQVLELAGVKPLAKVNGDFILDRKGDKQFPHRTVTYHTSRKPGSDSERSGIMHLGCQPVRLEDGMIFNVANTGNA